MPIGQCYNVAKHMQWEQWNIKLLKVEKKMRNHYRVLCEHRSKMVTFKQCVPKFGARAVALTQSEDMELDLGQWLGNTRTGLINIEVASFPWQIFRTFCLRRNHMMQKKAWNNYLHNHKITSLVKLAAGLNHQQNVQRQHQQDF